MKIRWKPAAGVALALFLLVMTLLMVAFFFRGAPRSAYIVYYKAARVLDGQLVFRAEWGWVDFIHYNTARKRLMELDHIVKRSHKGSKAITMQGQFFTALGGRVVVTNHYTVLPFANLSLAQRKAITAGIVMDMAHAEEAAQNNGHFWQGTDISAFQFDDLPSTWLACIKYLGLERSELMAGLTSDALNTWRRKLIHEGMPLAGRRVEYVPDFPEQAIMLQRLLQTTEAARSYWRLESSHTS